jgi:hypothetical protein
MDMNAFDILLIGQLYKNSTINTIFINKIFKLTTVLFNIFLIPNHLFEIISIYITYENIQTYENIL